MFSRLFKKIFPFHILNEAEFKKHSDALVNSAELHVANEVANLKVRHLLEELKKQREELDPFQFKTIVGLNDPSPVDKVERTLYVARVAGLYKDILQPKFNHMISNLHGLLEEATNDREYDQSLKGAIYFAKEVMLWGKLMMNEQIAIQTEQNNSSDEDKNIKS